MASGSWRRDREVARLRMERLDADPPECVNCGRVIPKPRRYQPSVKHCSVACSERYREKRRRERMRERRVAQVLAEVEEVEGNRMPVELLELPYSVSQTRRGPAYEKAKAMFSQEVLEDWLDHRIADKQMAGDLGVTPQAATLVRRQLFNERLIAEAQAKWRLGGDAQRLLGPSDGEVKEWAQVESADVFAERLNVLVDAFVEWRGTFFPTYHTEPVHRRWITETLRTIYLGERNLILSPPRHGKTDLLIHFCVWLICRNPDIRILWVGPNGDIADNCLGSVRDTLESHEPLKTNYLKPGESWSPTKRGGGLWSRSKFRVENRTAPLKQPTMWSTGVGGKILSLDADFIVVDDPADPDDSYQESGRRKTSNWFKVKLISRKMDHTGLTVISSRVHPEDLYSELIDNPNWRITVDRAHDETVCGLPLHAPHPGEEVGYPQPCVLFEKMNPLRHLRLQAEDVGEALFSMMYQNEPQPTAGAVFRVTEIREKCLDRSRGLGPPGFGHFRYVAGLDPAARGLQAGFAWAVQLPSFGPPTGSGVKPWEETYWMIDLETQQAGGVEGAVELITHWYRTYHITEWRIEDNGFQSLYFRDPRLKNLEATLPGLNLKPAHTGLNKTDREYGVAALAPLYHEGKVNLPYGTADARGKTDRLLTQLSRFTTDTSPTSRRIPSDILMASWFPHASAIRKWRQDDLHERSRVKAEWASYPDYDIARITTPPWDDTAALYPLN